MNDRFLKEPITVDNAVVRQDALLEIISDLVTARSGAAPRAGAVIQDDGLGSFIWTATV